MKIISGQRGSGKTYKLIEYSHENDLPILVKTLSKANELNEKSLVYFNKPVKTVIYGSGEYIGDVCIDEIDEWLEYLLNKNNVNTNSVKLAAATVTTN